MATPTIRQITEEALIAGREKGAIPIATAKPREIASVTPGKRRVVGYSEAFEILARRDVHEEAMEDLAVGLIVVTIEFQTVWKLKSRPLLTTSS